MCENLWKLFSSELNRYLCFTLLVSGRSSWLVRWSSEIKHVQLLWVQYILHVRAYWHTSYSWLLRCIMGIYYSIFSSDTRKNVTYLQSSINPTQQPSLMWRYTNIFPSRVWPQSPESKSIFLSGVSRVTNSGFKTSAVAVMPYFTEQWVNTGPSWQVWLREEGAVRIGG